MSANSNPTTLETEEKKKEKSAEEVHKPIVPFSSRVKSNISNAQMEKILELFSQVKINVPLLDAIQQVPSYAKFLKDMCTKKRKANIPKKIFLDTSISKLLSGLIPVKYKDPGCPTIACTIGQAIINRALPDLGASINLLPFFMYQQLGLGDFHSTRVMIQLADRSVKIPKRKSLMFSFGSGSSSILWTSCWKHNPF